MTFNEKIDRYMKDNNIPNLKKFASLANIPYTTLRDFYEKKSADNSRLSTIRKLSKYMKCSMDYLAYEEIEDINEIKINGYDINSNNDNNKVYSTKITLCDTEEKINSFVKFLNDNKFEYEIFQGKNNHKEFKRALKEKGLMDENENINEKKLEKLLKISDIIDDIDIKENNDG